MSILISPTLANEATPYYALAGAGGGGGVSALTAGPNVVLTPPSGVGSVQVSLSNVLTTSSTAPTTIATTWGAVGSYPTTSVAGLYTGSSFTPQNTGTHLIEVRCGFNVDSATSKAVINTTGEDFITIGLVNTTTSVLVSAIDLFPVPMSAAGNDYGLATSFVAPLVSTASYQLTRFATSAGGASFALGADNSGIQIKIIPLC
jgi:hypothetical protein